MYRLYLLLLCAVTVCWTKSLETVIEWKYIQYDFPTMDNWLYALEQGYLIPNTGNPTDVDVHYRSSGERRIFITIPRLTNGVPFSLAIIPPDSKPTDPPVRPYPDYQWHASNGTNCKGITSAVRTSIDECHRLWVLDSGMIGKDRVCPPQIVIFDLTNDTHLHSYEIPINLYNEASKLMNIITYTTDPPPLGSCNLTKAYIADVEFHGIIVYDILLDVGWRTDNKLMHPDSDFGTITIGKDTTDLMWGVLGLAITPLNYPENKFLYFSSLAGDTLNAVPLDVVDNKTAWDQTAKFLPRSFIPVGGRGVQCTLQAMDSKGNIYCVTLNSTTLFSWNIEKPYTNQYFTILANDPNQLQFATGIKVIHNLYGQEELWILTSRFQQFLTGSRKFNEINFRILACNIEDLQLGSRICKIRESVTIPAPLYGPPTFRGKEHGKEEQDLNINKYYLPAELGITDPTTIRNDVLNFTIDSCEYLWISDGGTPSYLIAYDLTTGKKVHRIRLPNNGVYGTPTIHFIGSPFYDRCDRAVVHIPNLATGMCITYDIKNDLHRSKKKTMQTFKHHKNQSSRGRRNLSYSFGDFGEDLF